jgi:Cu+-exporting ATPase
MHFNQQPADKKRFITSLQSEGKNVLMTGDGLNDAGAFMESNVALSVADDIYHFSPAGDAIIEASKFGRLFDFIKYAKKSLSVVKISFIISFLYNFIGLAFAITGNLSPVVAAILMPISSVTVVGFATLSTKLLAKKNIEVLTAETRRCKITQNLLIRHSQLDWESLVHKVEIPTFVRTTML